MPKAVRQIDVIHTETEPAQFNPSQAQINAFARLLMPEIKKFFADEQIQWEFAEWQKAHSTKV